MTPERTTRVLRTVVFVLIVSLVSMFFGACWGQWAGMMYAWSPALPRELWRLGGPSLVLVTAVHLGWISGLAVALWWCGRMIRRGHRVEAVSQDRKGISRGGVKLGVVAGVASTLALHLGLVAWFAVAMRRWAGWQFSVNLMIGLAVGALTGSLVGWCGTALQGWLGTEDQTSETHSTAQPSGSHGNESPADQE